VKYTGVRKNNESEIVCVSFMLEAMWQELKEFAKTG